MFTNNNRYNDYYLVNDMEMDNVDFEEVPKKCCSRRCKLLGVLTIICLIIFILLIIFVAVPLIFMNCIELQRLLIFTHFNLPKIKEYYEKYHFPAFKNEYVTVKDLDGTTNKSLGVWHILPKDLAYKALQSENFNYDEALLNSNYSVLIYFHGTGEARSYSSRKYQLLSDYFHVIAFDYRSYADSSIGELSERTVVNDCVQLYKWVLNKTDAPIYIWGHSLGAALATSTLAALEHFNIYSKGLILESGFTSLHDELYVHPYGKWFAWLPWFKAAILDPLRQNGFVFSTSTNILNISCSIMILHAEDDEIIPYKFGKKLYEIASTRSENAPNNSVYHQFGKELNYNHFYIYQDPFMKYFILDFIAMTIKS